MNLTYNANNPDCPVISDADAAALELAAEIDRRRGDLDALFARKLGFGSVADDAVDEAHADLRKASEMLDRASYRVITVLGNAGVVS